MNKKPPAKKISRRSTRSRPRRYSWRASRGGYGRWILLIILIILFIAFFTGKKSLLKLYSLHQQRNALQLEKHRLQTQNQELKQKIERLKTDPQAIQEIAREKYNLKKENEDVYIVEPE